MCDDLTVTGGFDPNSFAMTCPRCGTSEVCGLDVALTGECIEVRD